MSTIATWLSIQADISRTQQAKKIQERPFFISSPRLITTATHTMSYSSASATASTGLSELTNSSPLDDVDVPAAYWDLIKSDLVHIVQEDRIPTAIDYELLNWRSFADPLVSCPAGLVGQQG